MWRDPWDSRRNVLERDSIEGLLGVLGVYELQRIALARDTVIRDALPQPDPLRLPNRDQLTEVVNTIVRDDLPIEDAMLRELASRLVSPEDLPEFVALAISELSGLHEGNLARYRLRLSEFQRWRGRARPA